MQQRADRDHALDSLRGFAMLLGVLLHAALSFLDSLDSRWPIKDGQRSWLFDCFVLAVHDFRMQLFFLLAGFFGCLLYQRGGLAGLLAHRARRILLPLALALLLVQPTIQAVIVYDRAVQQQAFPGVVAQVANHFLSGAFLPAIVPAHLWFLCYLVFFFATLAVLLPAVERLANTWLARWLDAAFARLLTLPGRSLLLAGLTLPLLYTMPRWIVDTQSGWWPAWNLLAYYGGFFLFGWLLYRHRERLPYFAEGWRSRLAVANFLVLPAMLLLTLGGLAIVQGQVEAAVPLAAVRAGALTAGALYTWLMITGLIGAFRHYCRRERPWARYLADSSYWCYLMSLTPILLLQSLLAPAALPALVKFLLINVGTLALLLASYQVLVRYSWVGAILHGRKRPMRQFSPVAPAPAGGTDGQCGASQPTLAPQTS